MPRQALPAARHTLFRQREFWDTHVPTEPALAVGGTMSSLAAALPANMDGQPGQTVRGTRGARDGLSAASPGANT